MEFLYQYGLFFAKTITFLIAAAILMVLFTSAAHKPKSKKGEIQLEDVSAELDKLKAEFLANTLKKDELKKWKKAQKKAEKLLDKETDKKLYVIDFKGSIDAHEVEQLREEITAILTIARPEKDQVLVRLESGGGVVHGYGLAASQLQRIKNAKVELTICVDKVAASGGYMMACVADKLVAAPFSIIGSIGVIAQIPNFHKILKKNDVDFEQITAGEFKRTLTLFGENTDQARDKFRDEIQQTHELFKTFVSNERPNLNMSEVATGEHWFATQAFDKGLVDKIATSDDILLEANKERQIFKVQFTMKKSMTEKLGIGLSLSLEKAVIKFMSAMNVIKPH
ncbi:serine protease SohB [Pseudoalteromonas ulvae UL12]|uniref:protease SohB n=1 Tax=Pseudoalteromonas ulvae TaxID=107327 RepID=UPI00186B7803|nr:protease SohB [Pseudoalteromonas ulvae]MBE0362305.1 serine protease SohB [Pseudoalteromonas ulvae UL12]